MKITNKLTIGLHKRFACLWIDECGILTIQLGWFILEYEHDVCPICGELRGDCCCEDTLCGRNY